MFGMLVVRGTIKALTPIFHGGNEKTGSVVLLNRLRFIVDGEPVDVPYISGNAIRGYLRRLVFADFLRQVEYEIDVSYRQGLKLYHALFAGGLLEAVEEEETAVIDVEFKRKVLRYIPPARLWGFSFRNQMIEGKLKVGHALPVCVELRDFLPQDLKPAQSFYTMITRVFQTRKEEIRAPREEGEQAVQMIVEHEVFAPGTVFYHEFRLEDPDLIDRAVLYRAIKLWEQYPYIGGKSAIGMGLAKLDYDLSPLGTDDRPYLEFLKKNKEEIRGVLRELEGTV